MPAAIRVVDRIQDQSDGPGILGVGDDGKFLRWNDATGKFEVATVSAADLTLSNLSNYATARQNLFETPASLSITGGGTIALGGFTLTIPATGVAALLGVANVFTAINTFQAAPTSPNTAFVNTEQWGSGANASQSSATALGRNAVSGRTGVAVGSTSNGSSGEFNVVIGVASASTGQKQFVCGSNTASILDVFFGNGVVSSAPADYTINGTGASGANIAGGQLSIAAGRSTGNAGSGNISFRNSPAGSSGSSLNTLRTRWAILADGQLRGYQESSLQTREVATIRPVFFVSNDATRQGDLVVEAWDTAAREVLRGRASGSEPMIGFLGATPQARSTGWAASNVTPDKVFDADSTTLDEIADVLGTLIDYLKLRGDLGA